MLSVPGLPIPQEYTIRFSGERDASAIDVTFPGRVPYALLDGAKKVTYFGEPMFLWSPGSGSYGDSAGEGEGESDSPTGRDITTNITYNIGIQEQDRAELINKGFEFFDMWEDQIDDLVDGLLIYDSDFEGNLVGSSTYAKWNDIIKDTRYRLSDYFKEPIANRLKSIDDVMREMKDGFQSMLYVDPESNSLKLICLLDPPTVFTSPIYESLSEDFNLAHDPEESMEVWVVDEPEPFRLPPGDDDKYPRRVVTQRLSKAEATLEITLQRLREGSTTRSASAVVPAPHSLAELLKLLPGKAVKWNEIGFWITETTVAYPADTCSLSLYRADN